MKAELEEAQGGLRLHHVGYVVQEIAPAAAAYCTRFGYRLASGIIHDPGQTALVQFLQLPGDASWLEFVAPDGPASKLAKAAGRGGALHHLCYTSGPLEPAVARLREEGMLLLADPKPAVAFAGRRIAWLFGANAVLTELIERRSDADRCEPG